MEIQSINSEACLYYDDLDLRKITDNRKFSNTVKPFLSNKGTTSQKISLKEKEEIVRADIKIAMF